MDWQLAIAGFLVAGSAFYLLRVMSRSWKAGKGSWGSGCGCKTDQLPAKDSFIPVQEISIRKRIGEPGA
jgi:hypothetical protein